MSKLTSISKRVSTIDIKRGSPVADKRITGRHLDRIRKRILLRDEYTCQACGRVTAHGEVDHVVPLHLGGRESDENRAYLCRHCHKAKSDREGRKRGGENGNK